jgi:hypothetical protein
MIAQWGLLYIHILLPAQGPFPVGDLFGMPLQSHAYQVALTQELLKKPPAV